MPKRQAGRLIDYTTPYGYGTLKGKMRPAEVSFGVGFLLPYAALSLVVPGGVHSFPSGAIYRDGAGDSKETYLILHGPERTGHDWDDPLIRHYYRDVWNDMDPVDFIKDLNRHRTYIRADLENVKGYASGYPILIREQSAANVHTTFKAKSATLVEWDRARQRPSGFILQFRLDEYELVDSVSTVVPPQPRKGSVL